MSNDKVLEIINRLNLYYKNLIIEEKNEIINCEKKIKELLWEQKRIEKMLIYVLRYLTYEEIDSFENRQYEIPNEIKRLNDKIKSLNESILVSEKWLS
jgi:peptidoglycan hydrolase CwlO-like protein